MNSFFPDRAMKHYDILGFVQKEEARTALGQALQSTTRAPVDWLLMCSWIAMIQRALLIGSGVLLVGSLSAFFLYVPALSIATVVLLVSGLILMFGLGLQVGRREIPLL